LNNLNVKGLIRILSNVDTRVSDLASIEASRNKIRESFPRESKDPRISLDHQLEFLEISKELGNPWELKHDLPRYKTA